jgi:hypothetical protein
LSNNLSSTHRKEVIVMVKMDKEAARRIQSAEDKSGRDPGFKSRAMATAERHAKEASK